MAEKRRSKRHRRRLKVKFGYAGTATFQHSGLTNDVSATGLFVVSNHNPKPGARIHLEVMLTGEVPLYMEGMVARHVAVPPELRQVVRSGFGVRYLTGVELMTEMVPLTASSVKDDPLCLVFDEPDTWLEAVKKEYQRGGAFIWMPKAPAPNSQVTITFDLRFLDTQLEFSARVVHTTPGPDGRVGVALMFDDPTAAAAKLAATTRME